MTIILFVVSFVAIFAMLGWKVFEIKVRKIHFVARLFAVCDVKIHQFLDSAVFMYGRSRKIAHLFFFDFLPALSYELTVKLKDFIAKKYYEAGDKFRGRRILRDSGSVSTFLQHITEDVQDASQREA